ncbi:hypothetical protein AURDEDRAFT_116670 [Auricularia subglabra TFB-10046 SS5]|nr:hypothetical protein AURDEDRAFT_116670 [Auricularia subglabra TFB-10046 SS5]
MPVLPPADKAAPGDEKAQMDESSTHPASQDDAGTSSPADGAPSSGTAASPDAPAPDTTTSGETRGVIPPDSKPSPDKDASKPLSELAKAPASHPDVHPHPDVLDDDNDGLEDAVSGQTPVDANPEAPAPAKDGASKPPATQGAAKPPLTHGAEGAPAAGAEPAPKQDAKSPAGEFNDQGMGDPPAPPPSEPKPQPPADEKPAPGSVTKPPVSPPSDPKPASPKPKPEADATPPTTEEVQAALDRIYANANADKDRQRLANGHDAELHIPYRALGIVLLVFIVIFAGVRWKRRPRYGGYVQVPLTEVHIREEQAVKPRHYRD